MSQQLGLPQRTVASDPTRAQWLATQQQLRVSLAQSPVMAQWMARGQNLALAQDDLPILEQIKNTIVTPDQIEWNDPRNALDYDTLVELNRLARELGVDISHHQQPLGTHAALGQKAAADAYLRRLGNQVEADTGFQRELGHRPPQVQLDGDATAYLPRDARGIAETLTQLMENPVRLIPFLAAVPEAYKAYRLYQAIQHFKQGTPRAQDVKAILEWNNDIRRGSTFWGGAMDILAEMPAFAGELALTGGLFTTGRKATTRGVMKMIRSGMERSLTRTGRNALVRGANVAGHAAGIGLRTPFAMGPRIATETISRMTDSLGVAPDEAGNLAVIVNDTGEGLAEALFKSYTGAYITVFAETSVGGLINKAASPITSRVSHHLKAQGLSAYLAGRWLQKNPTDTLGNLARRVATATGWHGVLAEMGEEEVEKGIRYLVGLDQEYQFTTPEEFLQQLIAFSVIPGAATAIRTPGMALAARRDTAMAQQTQTLMDQLDQLKGQSKLFERSPDHGADLVAHLARDTPMETTYLDAERFTEYYQSVNEDPRQVAAQLMGDDGTAYDQALASGADLSIPLASYMRHIAATPHAQALREDLKLSPEARSPRELQALQAELEALSQVDDPQAPPEAPEAPETPEAQASPESAQQRQRQDHQAALDLIRQDFASQLQRAGRPAAEANQAGRLMAAYMTRVAQTIGADPLDYYQSRLNRVVAEEGGAAAGRDTALFQPAPPVEIPDSFDEYAERVGGNEEMFGEPSLIEKTWYADVGGSIPSAVSTVGDVRIIPGGRGFYAIAQEGNEYYYVGKISFDGYSTNVSVVPEYQGQGIGTELVYQLRRRIPFAPSGGLTDGGKATLRKVHKRLLDDISDGNINDDPNTLYQSAYHGSPHRGIERFSLQSIGTGEGNQAYGWGMYFASMKKVADWYRQKLSVGGIRSFDADAEAQALGIRNFEAFRREFFVHANGDKTPDQAARHVGYASVEAREVDPAAIARLIESYREAAKGQLYRVDIPEDSDLLDWDKPLSDQPEKVRQALQPYIDTGVSENTTGEDVYKELQKSYMADRLGYEVTDHAQRDASRYLLSIGIPGLRYLDGNSRSDGEGSHNYVIWDEDAIGIEETYYQGQRPQDDHIRGIRGFLRIGPDGRFTLGLTPDANPSTVLHELGHLFLEDYRRLAPQNQAIGKDLDIILQWLGVESASDITREHHEQFARGVEAYIMEGKAPSLALRRTFARFRNWLKEIYRTLRALDVELSPQVRSVFDRMLASDQAIEQARQETDHVPLADNAEQAFMSPAEYGRYRQAIDDIRLAAEDRTRAKVMAAEIRQRKRWWRKELAATKRQVAQELAATPEYIALANLQNGKLPDGSDLPEGMPAIKLDKNELVQRFGPDILASLPGPGHPRAPGRHVYTLKEGMPVDQAAELLGFNHGDRLIEALTQIEAMDAAVNAQAEALMKQRHGDPLDDGRIEQIATDALQGDRRAEVMRLELAMLFEQRRGLFDRTMTRVAMRPPTLAEMREHAQSVIGRQSLLEMKPAVHLAAQKRAARAALKAFQKGDHSEAYRQKLRELLNLELYRAVREAQNRGNVIRRHMARFRKKAVRQRLGKAGHSYLEQIEAYAEQYEFRQVTPRQIGRRQSLERFIERQKALGMPIELDMDLIHDARTINYRQVPYSTLLDVYAQVKRIESQARLKLEIMTASAKQDFNEFVEQAVSSAETNLPRLPDGKVAAERTRWDHARDALIGLWASMRKMSGWVETLDGQPAGGVWWDGLLRPLNEAQDREVAMRFEAARSQLDLFKAWEQAGGKKDLKAMQYIDALGKSMSLEHRLMVALNWGNEGNAQRLTDDRVPPEHRMSASQVEAVLDTLDKADWDLVQGIWDHIDSYWPEAAQKERRITGLTPEKVEARPVMTRHGIYRGGYFPIVYDARLSPTSDARQTESEASLEKLGRTTRATTRRGHLKAREEGLGEPLLLTLNVVDKHLRDVIHDLTHHEAVINANKILRNEAIAHTLHSRLGPAALKQMRALVKDLAAGDTTAESDVARFIRHMRNGVSIANIGFSASSALMQVGGVGTSIQYVGAASFSHAVRKTSGAPVEMAQFISQHSTFMTHRQTTQLREVREALNQVRGHALHQNMTRLAYLPITKAQMLVDMPTWYAAWQNALDAGRSESMAAAMADQAVRDTQGSGLMVDMPHVQRDKILAIFTPFYGFFGAQLNRTASALQSFRSAGGITSPTAVFELATDFFWVYAVPSALTVAVRMAMGQKGDDETVLGMFAKENLSLGMANFLILRDFSGLVTDGYSYRGPAGLSGLYEISNTLMQGRQGELDMALIRATAQTVGTFLHLPSRQTMRTLEGMMYLLENPTPDVRPLLAGPPRD